MTDENTVQFELNRRLLNLLEDVMTENLTVEYVTRTGFERTRTGTAVDLLGYILPSDQIVSVNRAV